MQPDHASQCTDCLNEIDSILKQYLHAGSNLRLGMASAAHADSKADANYFSSLVRRMTALRETCQARLFQEMAKAKKLGVGMAAWHRKERAFDRDEAETRAMR